ncbi:MFS transporter [Massilia sp. LXY-6]|uniref:MFS transporter n=1 Tax=Massilia sp. LXY-6 TaxID=3379823 RepID=UPI003EDEB193
MSTIVNAGGRLDRLPISSFHRRIMMLIGIGMFFDGFDIYIAATVLGATLHSGFSTMPQNALFVSTTFIGMMIGSFMTGFLGDRFGRRFTYQFNLLLFGGASILAAFAPNMITLIVLRLFIGIGLGAENVVGYSTLTEFVPAKVRGKWLGFMAVFVVSGLPVAALLGTYIIPHFSWRAMFILGGLGAIVVWYMRKSLPESPRWLESVGRKEEAEALMQKIEAEASGGAQLPAPAVPAAVPPSRSLASLWTPPLLGRMVVGCVCLIVINTLLYGFVTWLPTFFVKQGLTIATSFQYSMLMSIGAPIGSAIGALTADRWGRKATISISGTLAILFGCIYPFVHDPVLLPLVGFALTVPIYILVALLFAIYIPELFPTEVRLRASGICNTFGRGATIGTPFLVVWLFSTYGITGVLSLMVGLLFVMVVVVLAFGVESGKRSLEQIEEQEFTNVSFKKA